MHLLTISFRTLKSIGWCLSLSTFFLSGSSVSGQASAVGAAGTDPTVIQPGKTVEGSLSAGQRDKYRFTLAAGHHANLSAKETNIDLSITLKDSDGKIVTTADSQNSADGAESIWVVAENTATFEVEVSSDLRRSESSQYSISLSETRPATANDKALFEAARKYHEAIRLMNTGSQTDKVLELAKASLATRELLLSGEDRLIGESLVLTGRAHANKGDAVQADASFDRALKIAEKASGKESVQYAHVLLASGGAKSFRGDLKGAERLMLDAVQILEKTRDGGGRRIVIALTNLGLSYRLQTDFRMAELTYRRALEICEKTLGPDHSEASNILNNLGLMYLGGGDYVNAERDLVRSLEIVERHKNAETRDFAVRLNNLGLVYWRKGDYPKAEATWNRALSIFEKVNGPESDGVANILGNLGIVYKEYYNDYRKAEAAQLRAISIIEKVNGSYTLAAGTAHASLALIYRTLGDLQRAESSALRAHTVYEQSVGPNHQNVVLNLTVLAQLSAMKGDLTGSLEYQKRIHAIDNAAVQNSLIIGSERQKIAFFGRLRNTNRSISFLVNLAPTNAEARDLVLRQILQRKGRVLDALSQNLTEFRRRGDVHDASLLTKLNDLTTHISQLSSQGRTKRTQTEFEATINALFAERDKVESEISRRTAGTYVPSKAIELAEVRNAIPSDSALIEFAVYRPFEWNYNAANEPYGEPRYIAFVVRRQGEIGWTDLGDAKTIDDSIGRLRSALRDPGRPDVADLSRTLEQKITAPLRKLAGGASHLIISPDGELNMLPFEALVDEDRRYLAQSYSFTYVSSGRDLLRRPSPAAGRKDLLIVANPAFGLPADVSATATNGSGRQNRLITRSLSDTFFAPLAGTARESAAIKAVFPNATVLSGERATETSLKQVRSPEILHIATHGFFLNSDAPPSQDPAAKPSAMLSENPLLRAGLAFAGANVRQGNKDDGVLTGLEASGLDLSGTKLVVLSACDTGLGEIRNGEGVYGLRRSFALAGAESLVMSLWPVSDNVTRELMTAYYRNLKKGMGRGEALRQVRLEMLKEPDRKHPFYWASFIQSGEWANLDGKR